MKDILLHTSDYLNHSVLIYELEQEKILFTETINEYSLYPSIRQNQNYGTIFISFKYQDELNVILLRLNKNSNDETSKDVRKNKINYFKALLIIYSILVSVFCFKYWLTSRHVDINFDYRWNAQATILEAKKKSTGQLVFKYFDENLDGNFEKVYGYHFESSFPILKMFDSNEDGTYEKIIEYDLEAEYIAKSIDLNSDGFFEYLEFVLENGDTIKILDVNSNGKLELGD